MDNINKQDEVYIILINYYLSIGKMLLFFKNWNILTREENHVYY